ncbi:flagellar biosynthesis anti-sigma factor FlgM [Pontibacillus litoralis]|uniref:Negative regulator of flagellin synthesis n=1 Tax=Pontibacillus litoralis JSM 072002 TaxID=1385512 RepID=A0A0A5FZQ5_9BACI|nr:flagellar biosynthesis anti-sigma factor FlgM [Pontibacillus litoralis]KGX86316.1 hypothetical protein N784_05040 [Pontibacillus litoralis JSM 072002]
MKVSGPGHTNLNPYQKQLQQQQRMKQAPSINDKVEISNKAKHLQQSNKVQEARQHRIEQLKQQVQSGEYHVDAKKTAKNMISFWK